jgi:hypothetical protein
VILPLPRSNQSGATIYTHTFDWDNNAPGDLSGVHETESTTITVKHVPQ